MHDIGQHEFQVIDVEGDNNVDLLNKTCSCDLFQNLGIPCKHAIAAALKRNVSIYTMCSPFYTSGYWRECYKENIYPVGNEVEWTVSEDLKNFCVGVPVEKKPIGRPRKQKVGRRKRKHLPSRGEIIVQSRKCSKYGCRGHNKKSCKARL